MTAVASRSARGRNIDGFLLLDKPSGITSNHALQRTKCIFGARKAGHTGSLDPLATGMLPICFGAATKLSGYALNADKGYEVVARLGIRTETGDADGDILAQESAAHIAQEDIEGALPQFTGTLMQVPPMYSALKREGRRLYTLARQGIEIERQAREITISELELLSFEPPDMSLRVRCSKGTYVRTLVTDIARVLGTLGHVTALRRFGVYPFWGAEMVTIEELEGAAEEGAEALDRFLRPVDSVLTDWPKLTLDPDSAQRIRNGQTLSLTAETELGLYRLYVGNNEFVGIAEKLSDNRLVPRRIFL